MMGRLNHDQEQLLYSFHLDEAVPHDHPVRKIAAVLDLSWVHSDLAPFYPKMGRPSIDPELMIRMLIIGYVFAIRSERAICRDVQVNLAYRWFCGLSIEDKIPDHSAFSRARHERFRDSDMFRRVFERVVEACNNASHLKFRDSLQEQQCKGWAAHAGAARFRVISDAGTPSSGVTTAGFARWPPELSVAIHNEVIARLVAGVRHLGLPVLCVVRSRLFRHKDHVFWLEEQSEHWPARIVLRLPLRFNRLNPKRSAILIPFPEKDDKAQGEDT
jgi:transposase